MTAGTQLVAPTLDAAPRDVAAPSRLTLPIRIAPAPRWPRVDLAELWAARELLLFLVWRDVKVRYAQTALGAGWAVLQPLTGMVVFTVVFGRFARIPSDGAPYAAFSLAALVPWTYFAAAVSGAANSLITNRNLLTKIYFPRLILTLSPVVAGLVDFAVAFVALLLVLWGYGIAPSPWALVVVPLSLLIVAMTVVGVGSGLAALNVHYRDVRQITPFLLQVWMYGSPIVYPLSLVPQEFRLLYAINPMVGVVAGFRTVLLGRGAPPWTELSIALVTSAALLLVGARLFRGAERSFADVA